MKASESGVEAFGGRVRRQVALSLMSPGLGPALEFLPQEDLHLVLSLWLPHPKMESNGATQTYNPITQLQQ